MTTFRAPNPTGQQSATRATYPIGRLQRRIILSVLIFASVLSFGYAALSLVVAKELIYVPQTPLSGNPGDLGLQYQNITFPSRDDGVRIQGWFIPGVLPNGNLTAQRTIIVVHGTRTNRV